MNTEEIKILICGENKKTCAYLKNVLRGEAYNICEIQDIEAAIHFLNPGIFQALMIGLSPDADQGKISGLQAIAIFRKIDPRLPIIAIAHTGSITMERQARLDGVFYYLISPLDAHAICASLSNAVKKHERLVDNE